MYFQQGFTWAIPYRVHFKHEQALPEPTFKFQINLFEPWLLTAYAQLGLPSKFAKSFYSQISEMIIYLVQKYWRNWGCNSPT